MSYKALEHLVVIGQSRYTRTRLLAMTTQQGAIFLAMRLGTRCAVINDNNEILLSKRGDFGTWGLPGGRLDKGELLPDSAVREVYEETGLEVEIEHAVGLYFQQGRTRTNVLYRAKPIGGELLSATDETLDNRFFPLYSLPENLFGKFMIDHAYSGASHLHTLETPRAELMRVQYKLAVRWTQNLLAGKPEPRFPQFDMSVVGIIWDQDRSRVITTSTQSILEVPATGHRPFHAELKTKFEAKNWRWIGLWQNTKQNKMAFIFETTSNASTTSWKSPASLSNARHRQFVQMATEKRDEPVWLMTE